MIKRISDIEANLEKNKVLIVYGARQVGKTTLVKEFLSTTKLSYAYFTGDDAVFASDFGECDLLRIKNMVGDAQLLVIDEAQKVPHIGTALKLVVDNIEDIFVIATGSSSFDLSNATGEALTGRKNILTLFPLAIDELRASQSVYDVERNLPDFLTYGMYPNIRTYKNSADKEGRLKEITNSYLIADILEFQKVKSAKPIIDLLRLLAFQVGSEVSSVELGVSLGLDNKTVLRYLDLLEKSFILFRLDGFSKNLRKEVSKMSKYYFCDIGVRNTLIANYNDLDKRNDVGSLWENFLIMERVKKNTYNGLAVNYYFWRTYDQKEIDLIEERGGALYGYEIKWGEKKAVAPKDWSKTYPDANFEVINQKNYLDFISTQSQTKPKK